VIFHINSITEFVNVSIKIEVINEMKLKSRSAPRHVESSFNWSDFKKKVKQKDWRDCEGKQSHKRAGVRFSREILEIIFFIFSHLPN
jgi:hypothetical protein